LTVERKGVMGTDVRDLAAGKGQPRRRRCLEGKGKTRPNQHFKNGVAIHRVSMKAREKKARVSDEFPFAKDGEKKVCHREKKKKQACSNFGQIMELPALQKDEQASNISTKKTRGR